MPRFTALELARLGERFEFSGLHLYNLGQLLVRRLLMVLAVI